MSTNNEVAVSSPDLRYKLSANGPKGIIKKADGSSAPLPFAPPVTDIRNKIVCSKNSQFAVVGERGKFLRFSLNGEASFIGAVNIPLNGRLLKTALSPDGKILPAETNMSRLEVLDLEQGKILLSKDIGSLGKVQDFDFANNVLIVSFDSGSSREFDLDQYRPA